MHCILNIHLLSFRREKERKYLHLKVRKQNLSGAERKRPVFCQTANKRVKTLYFLNMILSRRVKMCLIKMQDCLHMLPHTGIILWINLQPDCGIYPSIHPLIFSRLSRVGLRGQGSPDFTVSSYFVQLLGRDPKVFPVQSRNKVPPSCFRSSRWPPTGGQCPKHPTRGASGRHSNQMSQPPRGLLHMEEQQIYSKFLPR